MVLITSPAPTAPPCGTAFYCLGPRLRALLVHRCDIWTVENAIVSGQPQATTYTLVAENVPCRWAYTPNVDKPLPTGRNKDANADTRDTVTFPYGAPVRNSDWLVERTLLPGGAKSNSYGSISRVQGAPKFHHPSHRDRFGSFDVNAMTDEQPPDVILAAVQAGA